MMHRARRGRAQLRRKLPAHRFGVFIAPVLAVLERKIKPILASLLVGLFLWSAPAGAKTYSLTVSVHKDAAELTKKEVKAILKRASRIMQDRAKCDVTFKLAGGIGRFDLPGANEITTEAQRDAVHNVKANVKIVDKIRWCTRLGNFSGCAYPTEQPAGPPSISIILTRNAVSLPNLWPHEVGHRMGLSHRKGLDRKPLMTACTVEAQSVELSEVECKCFLGGPLSCGRPQVRGCPPISRNKKKSR